MKAVVLFSAVVCSALAAKVTALVPAAPASGPPEPPINSIVPLEFPQYSQNYTFVDNSSIRENLASRSEGNDTEVDDLLVDDSDKEVAEPSAIPPIEPIILVPNPSEEDVQKKNETEWIEDGTDTEDDKFETTVVLTTTVKEVGGQLLSGHVAAIIAMGFLILSVFAYAGLMTWRRVLERKYGSREMLVDEDDFINPDDLKHFSI